MTKTRRFLTQFAKSQKQSNTRANYAFKKSIGIRSASRPFQSYVFIRCSLKTHHVITATSIHPKGDAWQNIIEDTSAYWLAQNKTATNLLSGPGATLAARGLTRMTPLTHFAELLSPTFNDLNATISNAVCKITKTEIHAIKLCI